jgi:hypothetical protein
MIVKCLSEEHRFKLVANRHVDLVMLCCIHTVSVSLDCVNALAVIKTYKSQPQYLEKTLTKIVISNENNLGDLTEYYKSIFIPAIRGFKFSKDGFEPGDKWNYVIFGTPTVVNSSKPLFGKHRPQFGRFTPAIVKPPMYPSN